MKVSKASKIWLDYHRTNSKKSTHRFYSVVMKKLCEDGPCLATSIAK